MLERLRKIFRYLILQVEVSRECNLDCRICMRKNLESNSGFMSFNNFRGVIDSYNFREVALHGWGEPLLNPGIFQMIRYAKNKGLRTSLTTNGTLVGKNISEIIDSGLDDIAFGFYDKKILMRSIDNVRELISEKEKRKLELRTFFDIAIFRDNLDEIFDVIRKANEIGVDSVVLHRLFNIHKVDKKVESLTGEDENELFDKVKALEKELNLRIYFPKKHTLPCRIVRNTIFVTYAGRVTPCCFLPEFYLGDAKAGIGNIIKTKEYRNFIANMKNHEICKSCIW
ncbi:MAG: radical SAM protein [Methanophagales archaeon]|nr:radical SAM protein [Methanophagales archaeon]